MANAVRPMGFCHLWPAMCLTARCIWRPRWSGALKVAKWPRWLAGYERANYFKNSGVGLLPLRAPEPRAGNCRRGVVPSDGNLLLPARPNPRKMSSREIAELTGKRHDNVMADTRNMLENLGKAAPEFSGTALVDGPNSALLQPAQETRPEPRAIGRLPRRWPQADLSPLPAFLATPVPVHLLGHRGDRRAPSPSAQPAAL